MADKDEKFDPESIKFVHNLEQFTTAITRLAHIGSAYMNAMMNAGFSRSEAFTLTIDYIRYMRESHNSGERE